MDGWIDGWMLVYLTLKGKGVIARRLKGLALRAVVPEIVDEGVGVRLLGLLELHPLTPQRGLILRKLTLEVRQVLLEVSEGLGVLRHLIIVVVLGLLLLLVRGRFLRCKHRETAWRHRSCRR